MSDWIAVGNSLPDDDTAVLVAFDDGEVWPAYLDGETWRFITTDPITQGGITHWMDFPEAPKKYVEDPKDPDRLRDDWQDRQMEKRDAECD